MTLSPPLIECTHSPTLIAHRGASACYPENSIAAIKEAINVAMRHPNLPFFIETDIRLSRDNVLMCAHDASLSRISSSHAQINQLDRHALQSLPLKSHSEIYRNHAAPATVPEQCFFPITQEDLRIATLDEVTSLIEAANESRMQHAPPIGLALEMKPRPLSNSTILDMAGRVAIAALRMLGLGRAAVNHMMPNASVSAMASFLEGMHEKKPMPMMVFSTGTLGERDIISLNEQLSDQAQTWLHQYDKELSNHTSRLTLHSSEETWTWKERAAAAAMPFTYIGSHLSMHRPCYTAPSNIHNTPAHHAPSQLLKVVNDPETMARAIRREVDIIASDNPALLAKVTTQLIKQPTIERGITAAHQVTSHSKTAVLESSAEPQPNISSIEHRAKLEQPLDTRIENER